MATKRKDSNRIVLKKGEYQRTNGTYAFRWTDENGKRHEVYAKDLDDLRAKESEIEIDTTEGLKAEARYTIINEMFDLWEELKRGLKDNTFENYKYMYNTFVRPSFGKKRVTTLKKSDVKKFYNYLADERCLQFSTIDSIHTVLHQVLPKEKTVIESYSKQVKDNGKTGLIFFDGKPEMESVIMCTPEHWKNSVKKKRKSTKTKAMALKPKLDIRPLTNYMIYGGC